MPLELQTDLDRQPARTRTLAISAVIHLLVVLLIVLNPDLLNTKPRRTIRIAGVDYDLSKLEMRELTLPPRAAPPKIAEKAPLPPMVSPPPRVSPPPEALPPPPPPPPPPPKPPDAVITPEDLIAAGARPDGQTRASRGNTSEAARSGVGAPDPQPPKSAAPEPPKSDSSRGNTSRLPQIANNNPNAMIFPDLAKAGNQMATSSIASQGLRGSQLSVRTGSPNGQASPNFSAENEATILSDTRGYDFGPYLNQVVNQVRNFWYAVMPPIAQLGQKGTVVIVFTITKTGEVRGLNIAAGSGFAPLDNAARSAIQGPTFPRLPAGFDGDRIDLQFTFLYNQQRP